MLSICRADYESVVLTTMAGERIFIRVLTYNGQVKLFFDAPMSVKIQRSELSPGICKHGNQAGSCEFCKKGKP